MSPAQARQLVFRKSRDDVGTLIRLHDLAGGNPGFVRLVEHRRQPVRPLARRLDLPCRRRVLRRRRLHLRLLQVDKNIFRRRRQPGHPAQRAAVAIDFHLAEIIRHWESAPGRHAGLHLLHHAAPQGRRRSQRHVLAADGPGIVVAHPNPGHQRRRIAHEPRVPITLGVPGHSRDRRLQTVILCQRPCESGAQRILQRQRHLLIVGAIEHLVLGVRAVSFRVLVKHFPGPRDNRLDNLQFPPHAVVGQDLIKRGHIAQRHRIGIEHAILVLRHPRLLQARLPQPSLERLRAQLQSHPRRRRPVAQRQRVLHGKKTPVQIYRRIPPARDRPPSASCWDR